MCLWWPRVYAVLTARLFTLWLGCHSVGQTEHVSNCGKCDFWSHCSSKPTLLLWRADQNISVLAGVDKYVITEENRYFTLIGGIMCWTALQPCHFLEKFLWHNIEKTFSNHITQQLWNPIMTLDSTVGFLHNITVTITIMLVEFLSEWSYSWSQINQLRTIEWAISSASFRKIWGLSEQTLYMDGLKTLIHDDN